MIVDYIRDTAGGMLAVHFSKMEDEKPESSVRFLTESEWEMQIAVIAKKKGEVIDKHIHPKLLRTVYNTPETLLLRKGKVQVTVFDERKNWIREIVLSEGDILLQLAGGHGFEILEDSEILEVKQGSYAGAKDKIRF